MSNQETHICRDYAEAIFRRATAPMEPKEFSPNWSDQPSRYKIYYQVERFPLTTKLPTSLASMADILVRVNDPKPKAGSITFEELSTLLLLSHGVVTRRLQANWNGDDWERVRYHQATYGRGTASGGGMYPTEIYWVCGQSGPLLPGVYHYDNAHHAMARLFTGDLTGRVQAAAFEHPAAAATDQFLLISLNFWKNSFKYNSFCYHVVTQDLGALLGSMRLLATAFGSDIQPLYWYQDDELNRLLGLETLTESVFAVIPVPISRKPYEVPSVASNNANAPAKQDRPLVHKESFQRSKNIIRFPLIESVHQAALIQNEPRPAISEAFKTTCDVLDATGEPIELPPPALDLLQDDVLEVFKKRKSSFGRFSKHIPLSLIELATMLYFGSSARNYISDLKREDGVPHFTRLMVFVNNVQGLESGSYSYDQERHRLWVVRKSDFSLFLQNHYFLQNYNFVETGVVIALVGRVDRMLDVYGNRGYRILNSEVGLVAQNIYMAVTALSLGCGAVLGFDNIAANKALGIEGSDQRTMLFLLVGHERQNNANFDSRLI